MKSLLMYVVCSIVCGLLLLPAGVATATELVWVPINPSFGGYAGNASWLMAQAEAQNDHIEEVEPYASPVTDPMEDFKNNLNRQLFSRLSSLLLDEAFGESDPENPLEPGIYTVGDYTIEITTNGHITVVMTDNITGNSTTITIPYY